MPSLRKIGAQYVDEVSSSHRSLVEKALYMRAQSYLAEIKSSLLLETIFEVDGHRQVLKHTNERLAAALQELEQKKVELAAEVARRKAIFDTEGVGVLVFDRQGYITDVNARFQEMIGRSQEMLLGQTLETLFLKPELDRFWETFFQKDGNLSTLQRTELSLRGPNERTLWCEVTIRPIQVDSDPTEFVSVWVDISRRREAERSLREAKTRAESANRAKGRFLTHMSHELRTPLNAILGYAQLLQSDETLDEATIDKLSIIEQSGRYLLTLVNDLLDIAKMEADKLELHPSPIRLSDFCENLQQLFYPQAEEKGLQLHCRLEVGAAETVHADEKCLRRILVNLLQNAIKFTPAPGRVSLRIRSFGQPSPDGQYRIRFEVEDTGIGIPSQDLERIFQPFEQLETEEYHRGTGLGLMLVRQLVQRMGGEIQVQSTPGQGSCFSFELLLPVGDEHASDSTDTPTPMRWHYQGPRKRVLVVDDDIFNSLLFQSVLKKAGFLVELASSGQEAIEQFQRHPPDLVLLDLLMPDLDGYQTLAALRRTVPGQSVPVVAVSANLEAEERARALAAGFSAFLGKPLQLDVFFDTLGTLLSLEWVDPPQPAAQNRQD